MTTAYLKATMAVYEQNNYRSGPYSNIYHLTFICENSYKSKYVHSIIPVVHVLYIAVV